MTIVLGATPSTEFNVLHIQMLKTPAGKSFGVFHRVTIIPGMDPAIVLASINAHLAQMGNDPIDATSWTTTVLPAVATYHTPAVIAAYKAAFPISAVTGAIKLV